jgi:TetR/AcrR family transcriptional regulator
MADTGGRRGRKRVYDAEQTRKAILDAAARSFAAHGFDGVSVDTIATDAGYNKSLIFQYFGDKLGLYTAVLKRADQEMSVLLVQLLAPLLADDRIATDAMRFEHFLTSMVEAFYDYMVEHPQFTRMLNWEQAEGWQTFISIASHFAPDDLARLDAIFAQAQQAGLLRPDLSMTLALLLIPQICWSVLVTLPIYRLFLGDRADPETLVKEQITAFIVAGILRSAQ